MQNFTSHFPKKVDFHLLILFLLLLKIFTGSRKGVKNGKWEVTCSWFVSVFKEKMIKFPFTIFTFNDSAYK